MAAFRTRMRVHWCVLYIAILFYYSLFVYNLVSMPGAVGKAHTHNTSVIFTLVASGLALHRNHGWMIL